MRRPVHSLALLLAAAGCGPMLPDGWESAARVPVVQRECGASPYDPDAPEPRLELVEGANGRLVGFRAVHFRCAQDVEGFAKRDGTSLEVLLQPVDMHPSIVAGCDCLYDVDATVDLAGAASVRGWTRQDLYAGDVSAPVLVGTLPLD